ncbi:MAG: LPS translocon maturation chaperone LptM [Panacagrimonas sp.]
MRILILLIPFFLTACGQSGPLYLRGTQPAPATKPVLVGAPKPDPAKPEEEEAKPATTPTQP